jgi:hypothetical protein
MQCAAAAVADTDLITLAESAACQRNQPVDFVFGAMLLMQVPAV